MILARQNTNSAPPGAGPAANRAREKRVFLAAVCVSTALPADSTLQNDRRILIPKSRISQLLLPDTTAGGKGQSAENGK